MTSALETTLHARHSCRAYLPKPVAPSLIEQAVATAARAPSWCNAQPWQPLAKDHPSREPHHKRHGRGDD